MNPPTSPTLPAASEPTEQARHWIVRLASGEMDEAELSRFEQWLSQPGQRSAFEHQRALWRSLQPMRAAFAPASIESASIEFASIESAPIEQASIEPASIASHTPIETTALSAAPPSSAALTASHAPIARPRHSPRRRRGLRWGLATAACALALVATMPGWLLTLRADHRTGIAPASYTLADGSIAVLDADSAIAVEYSGGERRIELLAGSAWFQVAHADARPFRVAALDGHIRDIGTAFEVRVDDGVARTAVSEGLVEVASARGKPVRVAAGHSVSYREGSVVGAIESVASNDIAAWRHGELLLDAVPPREALRRIARYRERPVWVVGSLEHSPPITATLRSERPDEAIAAIAERARLRVHALPGGALLVRAAN